MTRPSAAYEAAISAEVAQWPGATVAYEQGGKHMRAVLSVGMMSRYVTFPSTPSDSKGHLNSIGDVRRTLVSLGAVRTERAKSEREPSWRNPGADLRELPGGEPAPVMPNPWEALQPLADAPLAPGLHRLTSAAYHADPAPEPSLSATLAKLIVGRSPRHAWCASLRLNPDHQSTHRKTFDLGRAAHRAVLGCGDDFEAIPADMLASDGAASTKAAKAFVADARERGITPLKESECDQIEAMRVVASARLAEHGIAFDPARSELAALVRLDGIWCRAMFDHVPADTRQPIYDFKTCEDASPAACVRAIAGYGYDVQAAHYRAVWKAATGEDRGFVFVFQEKPAPHEVTLIRLSGSFQDVGEARAAKARRLWAECTANNTWPGYPVGLHEVDAPAWLVERAYEEAA